MISENRHSNGARKNLSRSHNKAQLTNRRHIAGPAVLVVNASKTCMKFFQEPWEQMTRQGCLRGSLSGKGQKSLTALIPAQGGDQ